MTPPKVGELALAYEAACEAEDAASQAHASAKGHVGALVALDRWLKADVAKRAAADALLAARAAEAISRPNRTEEP